MLIPAERQKKILNLIHQQGIVRITNLVELMGVSHMTIRRDIQKLEEKGKVVSVSGGVQLLERLISSLLAMINRCYFINKNQRLV